MSTQMGIKLVDAGYKVVFYELNPNAPEGPLRQQRHLKRLGYLEKRKIEILQGDVLDWGTMVETVKKYDVEGMVYVPNPGRGLAPWPRIGPCLEGMRIALEVARLFDLRFLRNSTGATYGPGDPNQLVKETDPRPSYWLSDGNYEDYPEHEGPKIGHVSTGWQQNNIYITHKIAEDLLTQFYHVQYGLDAVIIMPSYVFGPFGGPRFGHTVHYFMWKALQGETIELDGGGDHPEEYTFTKDMAQGMFLAYTVRPLPLRRNEVPIFNVGGGQKMTIRELIGWVKQVIPSANIGTIGPGPLQDPQHQLSNLWLKRRFDTSRIQSLGWKPTPYQQAFEETRDFLIGVRDKGW